MLWPEGSNIAKMAKFDDLGAPVVKPTDSNPDATKKSTQARIKLTRKHKMVMLKMKHLILKKVLQRFHILDRKKQLKHKRRHETINADAKTMADTYGMGMEKKHMKKEEVEEVELDVSADVDALVKDEDLSEEFKNKATTIFEAAACKKSKNYRA